MMLLVMLLSGLLQARRRCSPRCSGTRRRRTARSNHAAGEDTGALVLFYIFDGEPHLYSPLGIIARRALILAFLDRTLR